MQKTLDKGPQSIPLESYIQSMADVFSNLDVTSINHGFKKTVLSKFQSEPVLETQLTRDEDIMNLIESFDRFASSDSEEE